MNVIVKCGDITKEPVDAIVNAANETLLGGGGVDGAIHAAAGPGLREECSNIPVVPLPVHLRREGSGTVLCVDRGEGYVPVRCTTGKAVMTSGHNLPAEHVIHTVGPRCFNNEVTRRNREDLCRCWEESLKCAYDAGLKTIAFPSISTGIFGYPVEEAAGVALTTIYNSGLFDSDDLEVRIVCFSEDDRKTYQRILQMLEDKVTKV